MVIKKSFIALMVVVFSLLTSNVFSQIVSSVLSKVIKDKSVYSCTSTNFKIFDADINSRGGLPNKYKVAKMSNDTMTLKYSGTVVDFIKKIEGSDIYTYNNSGSEISDPLDRSRRFDDYDGTGSFQGYILRLDSISFVHILPNLTLSSKTFKDSLLLAYYSSKKAGKPTNEVYKVDLIYTQLKKYSDLLRKKNQEAERLKIDKFTKAFIARINTPANLAKKDPVFEAALKNWFKNDMIQDLHTLNPSEERFLKDKKLIIQKVVFLDANWKFARDRYNDIWAKYKTVAIYFKEGSTCYVGYWQLGYEYLNGGNYDVVFKGIGASGNYQNGIAGDDDVLWGTYSHEINCSK